MVLMGINGLYVMKQAGFCVEGRGELGLDILDSCHFLAIIQKTKGQSSFTIASQSSQMLLIHPMNDLGWF
jgi:hypothetical protein